MSNEWPGTSPDVPPAALTPPPALLNAVKLMFLGAAIAVLNLLITLLNRDAIEARVRQELAATGELSEAAVEAAVAFAVTSALFVGAAAVGLWILLAVYNKRGKTWARIVATVLGAVSVLAGLVALVGGGGAGLELVMTVIGIGLSAAILYLLWRPENAPYFAYNSARG